MHTAANKIWKSVVVAILTILLLILWAWAGYRLLRHGDYPSSGAKNESVALNLPIA